MKKYLIFIIISLMFIVYCDKGDIRQHTEKVDKNDQKTMKLKSPHSTKSIKNDDVKKPSFDWAVPKGWEIGENTSAVRVATLNVKRDNLFAVCTIIPLLGNGGGLEPNVEMWLGQVGIIMHRNEKKFKDFIANNEKFKTDEGVEVEMVDITTLQSDKELDSIMVSLIKLDKYTVFVKLRGNRTLLIENREKFKKLCKSIKLKKE